MGSGRPILYTSADSVFQVAAHEEVVPLPTLYDWSEGAREMLRPPHNVNRVIARPFVGKPGLFGGRRIVGTMQSSRRRTYSTSSAPGMSRCMR